MKLPAYPKYKPSGVEWLGDVPEHWEAKRLKYSASINDEALPETTPPDFEFEYVDIGGVSAVDGITATEQVVFENAPSRARRKVRHGDTIVSTVRTYLRAIAPIKNPPENLIVSTGFAVLRPRKVEPTFLAYALRESSFIESVVARSTGVSYPACNASEVGGISIPLPTLAEQRAIAAFLDQETGQVDRLVAKKRKLIERLKEKRTALISRTVTRGLPPAAALPAHPPLKPSGIEWIGDMPKHWVVKSLTRITGSIRNGTSATQLEDESDTAVPVTRIETISGGQINFERVGQVERTPGLEVYRLKRGDILLSHINSLSMVGNCAIYDSDQPLYGGMNLLRIRPEPTVHSRWLWRVLSSDGIRKEIGARAKPAINQASVTTTQIKALQLAVPPLPEQSAIAVYLDTETAKLDALVGKVEAAVERLQEYRTALITAAVTGKIDVRKVAQC